MIANEIGGHLAEIAEKCKEVDLPTEQVKAFLIQKLASAQFYSKMQPLGIGGDDRLEMDHI